MGVQLADYKGFDSEKARDLRILCGPAARTLKGAAMEHLIAHQWVKLWKKAQALAVVCIQEGPHQREWIGSTSTNLCSKMAGL